MQSLEEQGIVHRDLAARFDLKKLQKRVSHIPYI